MYKLILLAFLIICCTNCNNQSAKTLSAQNEEWKVLFRNVTYDNDTIHLDAQEGEGLVLHQETEFENGIVEFDIKGNNDPGRSFVGIAFHYQNEKQWDAIYFRPFNFKNPDRNSHSVQYISMPGYEWRTLREKFPGKYENEVMPVPEPVDDWFHVKVVIDHPSVEVYVNGSSEATLQVEQKSNQKKGKLGFWVGHNSEGWFKNMSIIKS